jgi:glutathione S-transferase
MMVRLYYSEGSTNCQKVHLALLEVGADYELVHVDLKKGDQKRPEYVALNPNGKVPTLVDGDFVLWESNAIVWYLAEKYPATGLLPEDRIERAAIQQMMFWQATALGPAVRAHKTATEKSAVDAATLEVAGHLRTLARLLAGDASLVGDSATIADLVMGPSVERALQLGHEVPSPVNPWLEAMRARPSWAKVFGAKSAR